MLSQSTVVTRLHTFPTYAEAITEELCARYKRSFVGTRRLIDDFLALGLWDDSVADGQHGKEFTDSCSLPVVLLRSSLQLAEILLALLPLGFINRLSVHCACDGALAKFHLVAGQGASLVREDVLLKEVYGSA